MKFTFLIIVFFTFRALLHASEEPRDLTKLRERYLDAANLAVTPITKVYIRELKSLRANYQRKDVEKAAFIDAEIQLIEQLDGKGLVRLEQQEAIAPRSPLEVQMASLTGIWQDKGDSYYEFKLPDVMTITHRYRANGGGVTIQAIEYKATVVDEKLIIEQVGSQNPQYKNWYEARLPLSLDDMRLKFFNVSPGSKTSSTVQLTKTQAIASASVWHVDTVGAICDRITSKKSSDYTIPRQTWFPTKGSNEWVQLEFSVPRKVSECSVYWFDDVCVGGGCRVPETAHILYKSGEEWNPVAAKRKLGVSVDNWNKVEFEEVETTALRLQVQMHEEYSAGVLEWKFE